MVIRDDPVVHLGSRDRRGHQRDRRGARHQPAGDPAARPAPPGPLPRGVRRLLVAEQHRRGRSSPETTQAPVVPLDEVSDEVGDDRRQHRPDDGPRLVDPHESDVGRAGDEYLHRQIARPQSLPHGGDAAPVPFSKRRPRGDHIRRPRPTLRDDRFLDVPTYLAHDALRSDPAGKLRPVQGQTVEPGAIFGPIWTAGRPGSTRRRVDQEGATSSRRTD